MPNAAALAGTSPPSGRSRCGSARRAATACSRAACRPPRRCCARSPVDLPEHDVLRADPGHGVREHVPAYHLPERAEMREPGRAALDAVGLVGAIGDQVDAELTLWRLDRGVGIAGGDFISFSEELEVVNERFHVFLHELAPWGPHLAVIDHGRSRMRAQPLDALADEAVRLTHLLHPHQITVVAVAIHPERHVEIQPVVDFIGLLLAQIPGYP